MASLVSVLISASRPTALFFMEQNPGKLALTRPLRQLNYRTATKRSAIHNTTDAILILNRVSQQHRLMASRLENDVVSCCVNVESCAPMVFSGYWVGPDAEDGWGFVEAFVNRI